MWFFVFGFQSEIRNQKSEMVRVLGVCRMHPTLRRSWPRFDSWRGHLWISDLRFRIADFNPKSEIENPKWNDAGARRSGGCLQSSHKWVRLPPASLKLTTNKSRSRCLCRASFELPKINLIDEPTKLITDTKHACLPFGFLKEVSTIQIIGALSQPFLVNYCQLRGQ